MGNLPSPDEYSAPVPATGTRNFAIVLAHGYPWGLFLALLALGIPSAESIFRDFGVPLPRMTAWVFGASHLLNGPAPAFVAVPVVLLLVLFADWLLLNARCRRGEEGTILAIFILMFGLPLVLTLLTLGSLWLPFLTITHRLSG